MSCSPAPTCRPRRVISEYVDVAKAFYDARETGFVNGLLDAIAKRRSRASDAAKPPSSTALRALATDPAARGLVDDAAVLERAAALVLTHDMIVEGVHFCPTIRPATSPGSWSR